MRVDWGKVQRDSVQLTSIALWLQVVNGAALTDFLPI